MMHFTNNNWTTFRVFIVCCILLGCGKFDFQPLPDTIQEEIEQSIEKRAFDGMIVCVNRAGKIDLYSSGWKDRENLIPIASNNLFKIASISKLFVAVAASKLIAVNKLHLDQSLQQLIPETAGKIEHSDRITLEMLISHRSGIPDYVYHPDLTDRDPHEAYMATASLIFDTPLNFKPGEKYAYSNTNYLLLGEILDRTLGYSHHVFIKNEILVPLSLTNTYSLYGQTDTNEVINGYFMGYNPSLRYIEHTGPGGSMISTAEEVSVFIRALIDGTLLTEKEQEIYSSVYEYEHTGWLNGYTSIARYHEDIDAVVVQFVNTSYTGMFWIELERVYERLVKILERKKPQ